MAITFDANLVTKQLTSTGTTITLPTDAGVQYGVSMLINSLGN